MGRQGARRIIRYACVGFFTISTMFNRLEKFKRLIGLVRKMDVWLIGIWKPTLVSRGAGNSFIKRVPLFHHASESIFNELYRAQRKRLASQPGLCQYRIYLSSPKEDRRSGDRAKPFTARQISLGSVPALFSPRNLRSYERKMKSDIVIPRACVTRTCR